MTARDPESLPLRTALSPLGCRMRQTLVATIATTALLAPAGAEALACSCAGGDPREALAGADGAFIGVVVDRRAGSDPSGPDVTGDERVVYTFRIEEALKGELGDQVAVESSAYGASCGLEVDMGERIGLLLYRRGEDWGSSLCSQYPPDELRKASRPLPVPDGTGPVAFLVGGPFGEPRTIALDRGGRILAYGPGAGEAEAISVCPGSRRAAELVAPGSGWAVAVSDVATLRTVREIRLRYAALEAFQYPSAVFCADRGARRIAVFASDAQSDDDPDARSRLLLIEAGRVRVLHRGHAAEVAFHGRHAYLDDRRRGGIFSVRLDTGAERRIARVPRYAGPRDVSPGGTTLAAVSYAGANGPPVRAVLIDLSPDSQTS